MLDRSHVMGPAIATHRRGGCCLEDRDSDTDAAVFCGWRVRIDEDRADCGSWVIGRGSDIDGGRKSKGRKTQEGRSFFLCFFRARSAGHWGHWRTEGSKCAGAMDHEESKSTKNRSQVQTHACTSFRLLSSHEECNSSF
jgi:hypothetical protein